MNTDGARRTTHSLVQEAIRVGEVAFEESRRRGPRLAANLQERDAGAVDNLRRGVGLRALLRLDRRATEILRQELVHSAVHSKASQQHLV